jgi:hypothetical protein
MRMVEHLIEETRRAVAASLKEAFDAGALAAAHETKRRMATLTDGIGSSNRASGPNADEAARTGARSAHAEDRRRDGQSYCEDATRGLLITPLGLIAFFALAALAIWRWTLF